MTRDTRQISPPVHDYCAHLCRCVCLKWRVYMPLGASILEDVPLVEFMYLVFTRMPGESYRRGRGSLLLYLCDGF